jgi:hypothetical protein
MIVILIFREYFNIRNTYIKDRSDEIRFILASIYILLILLLKFILKRILIINTYMNKILLEFNFCIGLKCSKFTELSTI